MWRRALNKLWTQIMDLSSMDTTKDEWVSLGIAVYPAGNHMLKLNNRNTRTRCELYK